MLAGASVSAERRADWSAMADIFFRMLPTPEWAQELSHRVLDDADYRDHCTIEWRWGDPRPKSWANPVRRRVVIRAPADRGHAALASTLLHELAHLVLPPGAHHSRAFWLYFYGLVERYGSGGDCALSAEDAYVLSRHYRVTAIKVAAELGVRAARSDLAERVPGAPDPRHWLGETLALERRLYEQTCEACSSEVFAAPGGARQPTGGVRSGSLSRGAGGGVRVCGRGGGVMRDGSPHPDPLPRRSARRGDTPRAGARGSEGAPSSVDAYRQLSRDRRRGAPDPLSRGRAGDREAPVVRGASDGRAAVSRRARASPSALATPARGFPTPSAALRLRRDAP